MLRNTAIALVAGSLFANAATPTSALSSPSACVLGAFHATCPIAAADLLTQQKFGDKIDSPAAHGSVVQVSSNDPAGFADVVEAVKSAVIGVRAGATQEPQASRKRNLPDSPFEPRPRAQQEPRSVPPIPGLPQDSPQITQGSGFFITADGYAVTNRHVVENDKTVEIKTDDQKTYPAKVIGTDSVSDLAFAEGRRPQRFSSRETCRQSAPR